jgi:Na+-driven multidrug efflux pump
MGVMLFNIILGSSEAVAAYQTAGRIEHFFFLPIISIATSLVTLVGMFYGAKRIDLVNQIVKYGISRAVTIAIAFSLLFFFIIAKIIPVFTSEPKIIELTIKYFKIMAFAYPFITIGMTSSRIMQGLGYANPMLILTLLRVVIIAASLAWYFVNILGKPVHYAWVGTLISCIVTSFVAITWLWIIIRRSLKPALETG